MCVLFSGRTVLSPHPSQTMGINWDSAEELPEKFLPQNVAQWEEVGIPVGNIVCPGLCPWELIWEQYMEYLEGHRVSRGRKPLRSCWPENLCHSQWILMPPSPYLMPPSPHGRAAHELQWLIPPYKAPRACSSVSDIDQGLCLISSSALISVHPLEPVV